MSFYEAGARSLLKKMPDVNSPVLMNLKMLKPRTEIGTKGAYIIYTLTVDSSCFKVYPPH